jgi:ribosomal protein S18 acetylase RimI-like enzyme
MLDPLRARFPWSTPLSDENPDIEPLRPEDLGGLRLPWLSKFSSETLDIQMRANPGLALWVPKTGEYIVAERWRRRDDIGHIVEVTARKGKAALVKALLEGMREQDNKLALLSDEVRNGQPRLYDEIGFGAVEKIVFFQRELKGGNLGVVEGALPELKYRVAEQDDLEMLIQLDHGSFPWLWWNSPEDMSIYMGTDGVWVYIAWLDSLAVGYASFTKYNGWAHLDRLAVVEEQQGRRYGAAQLNHALGAMIALGAGHVGLSTQENNVQSHKLYRGFGFRQTRDSMNIYGVALD